MARVFKRGELKQAIITVISSLGDAHGYAIMAELRERIGGGWKPSPGAIYPALLSLEEMGMIASVDQEGTRIYSLTAEGRRALEVGAVADEWVSLAERARDATPSVTAGSLLDEFASAFPMRRKVVAPKQARAIEQVLSRAAKEIESTLETGDGDGRVR
jgi:DNA-binding PadR family transcriptional regulator